MQTPPLPCHPQLEMSALVFFVSSIDPSHPMGLIIFLLSNLPQPFTLLSLSTIEAQSTGTSMTLAGWGSISGLGAPCKCGKAESWLNHAPFISPVVCVLSCDNFCRPITTTTINTTVYAHGHGQSFESQVSELGQWCFGLICHARKNKAT